MTFRYSVVMAWSLEDGGYIAAIPELPNLSAFGETAEEAAREVEVSGSPAPAPQELPSFSGQFRVRLPASLHEALVKHARREGVSLNTLVVGLLAEGLGVAGERFLSNAPGRLQPT
jgi:antitoxin HicB